MIGLTCREIIEASKGRLICGDIGSVVCGISTDSRKIEKGNIFIPIKGEKFDGHDFIPQAFEAGAVAALTHKECEAVPGKVLIKVEDTLKALSDIARYYRLKFQIPFVAVTGSVGKTSTKDMIWSVLMQKYATLKTEGNFNNEIGLPLTIFNLDASHQVGVVEMGMSGFGEISRLTSIVRPDIAVVTNIGMSHIEKLGSRQNILKAKMEIIEGMGKDGLLVLNGDDNLLRGLNGMLEQRTVFYGMDEGHQYQAYNIQSYAEDGTGFEIFVNNKNYNVRVPVPGVHNIYNALAAIAVGVELKVPMELIVKGIADFRPGKMRLNIMEQNGVKIIDDAYNASPQSMEAAIGVLKDLGSRTRTIAVLGDMLELGDWALKAHLDIGKFAFSKGIKYIVTVGENGRNIAKGALEAGAEPEMVYSFNDNREASVFLKSFLKSGDVVLVKGSRGMRMEEIVEYLTAGGQGDTIN